jgi:DNA-binding NtrC family response regulator
MWFHVIEDEPGLRKVMGALVTIEGYKAACFESAEAYLDFFSSPQYITPAAVIIDNRLPGMRGTALVRHIREHRPLQKMVIATATLTDIKTAKTELCYELPKPFRYEQLKLLLRGLVECTETYGTDPECFEHGICEFGLEHLCPFAPAA